ncbi:MAG: histidine phosphatase family protein [Mycobacterium sp.]|nr:histidine phosphatase family protein [Mycobacterium sp.]
MRTLVLMRHAKSDYPEGVVDHGRPLAPRGRREASLAGEWMRENVPAVDAVLCSSATRTRQTLARTGVDAPAAFLDRLYGASPGEMIAEINRVADEAATLLVVGHEPTVSQVALGLAGPPGSDADAVDRIKLKFPTSGIAVLRVPGSWAGLELGGAELTTFHVPR